ncbi:aspartate aminotransferase [Leptolyngbya sp. 'hensonii']|uniref:pyridoxal phosphate-dependent aminotransferase n=1 Tax=Leptolyngbya sp. 'hensonii' TaxID=1922337 RepID=UPI00094FE70C|nr:pyridoxal phosphate-dependent aminotransferase [Leptolyngbya sp. 'hensonii']OLP18561.1 aspartate aminotransferase [Leptolyngbya sp. 'hensonii']
MLTQSARLATVQSPIIPVIGDLIRAHPGTISLGQGVVYYGPPPEATAQLAPFLANPNHHQYQSVQGIPPLLAAIQRKLETENKIALTEKTSVLVTAGGNMGFMNALLAIADPGDEIILQTPYYFNHEMAIRMANCKPVLVPTDEHYQLQPAAIRAALTPRTRAIVTISPNNPTGAVYSTASLTAVNDLCREHGCYHISDEAYEYFTYDGASHFSPASLAGSQAHTISLFSLSKAYGLASWRIGYMVMPAHLLTAVKKIQDTIVICPPVISQYAAMGALQAGKAYCQQHLSAIAQTRTTFLTALTGLSDWCRVPPSQGAFYLLLTLQTDLDDFTLAKRLIQSHRVAVLPGNTFGITDSCSIRVAYGALQQATALEGLDRLLQGLTTIIRSGARPDPADHGGEPRNQ